MQKWAACLIYMDINRVRDGIFLLKPYASQVEVLQLHYVIISEMCLVEIQRR